MHKENGQRVTDAALIPITLNTYGGVGEKATEFLHAITAKDAKRIINEFSLLAVLLSAEMILSCHAPLPLPNLLFAKQNALPAAPHLLWLIQLLKKGVLKSLFKL